MGKKEQAPALAIFCAGFFVGVVVVGEMVIFE